MTHPSKLIGRVVAGRYTITGFIGEGGMARVYRGLCEDPPGEVAIKIMRGDLTSDPVFLGRFRREALAAARLSHRNIARVIEHGVSDELAFIVMELLEGVDLYAVLAREGRMAEARAASVVFQVCSALERAHRSGIVHRDLKPENVMLCALEATREPDDATSQLEIAVAQTAQGWVKVLDFGIAKLLERPEGTPTTSVESTSLPSMPSTVLTTIGALIGTPEYMSPEQCRGEPIDARSDLYACGMLFYQLVTARLPFEDRVPLKVITRQVDEKPKSPRKYVPSLSASTERIILKALAKSREARHQSAAELKEELIELLVDLETVNSEGPVTPAARHAPGLPRIYTPTPLSSERARMHQVKNLGGLIQVPDHVQLGVQPDDGEERTIVEPMQIFADAMDPDDEVETRVAPRPGAFGGRLLRRSSPRLRPSTPGRISPAAGVPAGGAEPSGPPSPPVSPPPAAMASPPRSPEADADADAAADAKPGSPPAPASPPVRVAARAELVSTAPSMVAPPAEASRRPPTEPRRPPAAGEARRVAPAPAPERGAVEPADARSRSLSLPMAIAAGIAAALLTFLVLLGLRTLLR